MDEQEGFTPILAAIGYDQNAIVELLIDSGADLNHINSVL